MSSSGRSRCTWVAAIVLLAAPPSASAAYSVVGARRQLSSVAATASNARRRAASSLCLATPPAHEEEQQQAQQQEQQEPQQEQPTTSDVAAPATTELGAAVRADFPILDQEMGDAKPLVYLDSAATSQKPTAVINAMRSHEERDNANVHRGAHELSMRSTAAYEAARSKVAAFVGAADPREIVFTRGATEAINLVANSWGRSEAAALAEGDEIVLTVMEHHSNLVPWQLLAKEKGLVLRYAQLRPDGRGLDMDHFASLVNERTRLIGVAHVSNTLGCVNPIGEIGEMARRVGARLLVDACQSVPHMPIDVATLGADFVVASGHKMCGPTGIGFLWSSYETLEALPPWQGGGEMIDQVSLSGVTFAPPPGRFEAGTPAITQAIGLGAACDYLTAKGMANVEAFEGEMGAYLYEKLSAVEGVTVYGPPPPEPRAALCAFTVDGVHPSDLATFLDHEGIAIRAGHHCTQPLHAELGLPGTARASLYLYNTRAEVDAFVDELVATVELFKALEG